MAKSKYYYAIVNRYNGKPLIEDKKMPIYFNKEVCIKRVKLFPKYAVVRIPIDPLDKMLLSGGIIYNKPLNSPSI